VEGNMSNLIRNLWLDDDGQDLAEYGLLLMVISALLVIAFAGLRNQISTVFGKATSVLVS
jgi:Flp pilus assembly pilin Flp